MEEQEIIAFIDKELKFQSKLKWEHEANKLHYRGYVSALQRVKNHITGNDSHIYNGGGVGSNVKID